MVDGGKFLPSNIYLLISILLLTGCYSTIGQYRRFEGYASEKVNNGVNETLDCAGENKDKSYCDDSNLNKEKQYQDMLALRANALKPKPVVKAPPSQTPLAVSKGPVPDKTEADAPAKTRVETITPLTPGVQQPTVSTADLAAKKPLAKKSPTKKKVAKKSLKKPVKKSPVKKKAVKKPEASEKSATPAPAAPATTPPATDTNSSPLIDKPLLPKTTDDMLELNKISP